MLHNCTVRCWGGCAQPGLHYAVNADIIRLTEWSNILQVQVLYGDVKHNLLSDAPEWHQAGPRHVYPGGHQIKLYVSACSYVEHL